MKIMQLVLVSAIAVGFYSSCNVSSKEQFNLVQPPPPQRPPPGSGGELQQQDLRGKSFADVMSIKYTRAELVCSLWTMLADNIDLERIPNAEFRVDLKSPVVAPQQFALYGTFRGLGDNQFREVHRIDVSFHLYKTVIRETLQVTIPETQTRYNFQYTPEIGFSTNVTIRSWTPQPISDRYSRPQNTVREKLRTDVINFVSDVIPNDFGLHTYDYVKCVIETDIRPEYQHQCLVETAFPDPLTPTPSPLQ